jgi:hypothetical protein
MSVDRCSGCARIWGILGAVLISPIAAIVGLVVLALRGVDLMLQRRAGAGPGQDPDRGTTGPRWPFCTRALFGIWNTSAARVSLCEISSGISSGLLAVLRRLRPALSGIRSSRSVY